MYFIWLHALMESSLLLLGRWCKIYSSQEKAKFCEILTIHENHAYEITKAEYYIIK